MKVTELKKKKIYISVIVDIQVLHLDMSLIILFYINPLYFISQGDIQEKSGHPGHTYLRNSQKLL